MRWKARWKARLEHIGRGLWRFLGPVHDSVKGALSDAEFHRVATKMVVMWVTTATPTIGAMFKDPENLTLVIIPFLAAVVTGVFDAAFHMQTGDPPTPKPPQPPSDPSS